MSFLGEIKLGRDIGKNQKYQKYIYHACIDCGKERWVDVTVSSSSPNHLRCCSCSSHCNNLGKHTGSFSWNWQGGKFLSKTGYVFVKCPEEFSVMANVKGYVQEHRLTVAQSLERPLRKTEFVHHRNGIKADNQQDNLQLFTGRNEHFYIVVQENRELKERIKELEEKVKQMEEAENA